MTLPKLHRPVKIKFWSLRNGLGDNYGVIFDIDTEVVRTCRRVIHEGEWHWQIVNFSRDVQWDWSLMQDLEVLEAYGNELEWEYA